MIRQITPSSLIRQVTRRTAEGCDALIGVAKDSFSTAGESTGNSSLVRTGDVISVGDIIAGADDAATAAAAAAAYLIGGRAALGGGGAEAVVPAAAGAVEGTGGTGGASAPRPNFGNSAFVLSIVLFRLVVFLDKMGEGGSSVETDVDATSLEALLAGVAFFGGSSFAGVLGAGVGAGDDSMGSTSDAESRDCSSWCNPNSPAPKSSSSRRLRSS